jgi:type I restriction enzyme S subunit
MAVWSILDSDELARRARLDAEYFQPRYLEYEKMLSRLACVTLDDVGRVTDGIHASPDVVDEDGVRYLSAKSVKDNEFSVGDALQISRKQDAENSRTRLREGDLLITTVGTIGNAAVVTPEILPANIDWHLGLVRFNSDVPIDSYFTATFLNSTFGRFQTLREATGNVQLNLFIEKIKTLKIPELPVAAAISKATRNAYDLRSKAAKLISDAEKLLTKTLDLDDLDNSPSLFYERDFTDFQTANRFGAEYFMPCKQRVLDALAKQPGRLLNEHCQSVRELFDATDARHGELVRNFDLTAALEPVLDDNMETMPAAEIGSTKKKFRVGDVVISRLRSYLREIAVVRTSPAIAAVGSSEFIVLRPRENPKSKLTPETLLIYLRSLPVQTILKWSQDGSAHPRFDEDDLLAIPVPDSVVRIAPKIDALVNEALTARAEAARLLEAAKAEVERLVLKTSFA